MDYRVTPGNDGKGEIGVAADQARRQRRSRPPCRARPVGNDSVDYAETVQRYPDDEAGPTMRMLTARASTWLRLRQLSLFRALSK